MQTHTRADGDEINKGNVYFIIDKPFMKYTVMRALAQVLIFPLVDDGYGKRENQIKKMENKRDKKKNSPSSPSQI